MEKAVVTEFDAKAFLKTVTSQPGVYLSLIHISEPTRQAEISYAVFCLKKKKKKKRKEKKKKIIEPN